MKADELRALQGPLKSKYRSDPDGALVTSRARVTLDPARLMAHLDHGRPSSAGLHSATGGTEAAACSADMLLEALAACAGVTLMAVATSTGVELRSGTVMAEGTWDARGTLAVDKTVPVGMQEIKLTFDLDTPADHATRARLVLTTERYCVILATLKAHAKITLDLKETL